MSASTLADIPIEPLVPGTSRSLTGVLGIPDGPGPWPGMVVVHEAFGVNDVMRRQVERLRSMGYLTLLPDLFTEGGSRKCLQATFRALRSGQGRAFSDIEAARQTLLGREDCTGEIGVIGFCMGGGFALISAGRGFDAASVNYGVLPQDLDGTLDGACPIIASYGAKDRTLKGAATQLEEALERKGIEHDVTEYPNAGHAFLNDADSGPVLLRPLLRVMGIGPAPEQAEVAWVRIEEFLATHLKN